MGGAPPSADTPRRVAPPLFPEGSPATACGIGSPLERGAQRAGGMVRAHSSRRSRVVVLRPVHQADEDILEPGGNPPPLMPGVTDRADRGLELGRVAPGH